MNFSYKLECKHGDGVIRLTRAEKVPPDSLLIKCPFGGGEDVIAIKVSEPAADRTVKDMRRGLETPDRRKKARA